MNMGIEMISGIASGNLCMENDGIWPGLIGVLSTNGSFSIAM